MSAGPRAVIGAPVYNHEREFREAIESILSQTFRDFRLVLVDDCSSDSTQALAQEYVRMDPRVVYFRNENRLGMIDNWRRAFNLGFEQWPDADYFAWASDHDVWHPRWLGALIQALDRAPEAVLAYPWNLQIEAAGTFRAKGIWKFETRGVTRRARRFWMALMNMSAGNMVYGLARARDVKACGVFRHVLVPDRMLIMELSLRGEFHQVPQVLWMRRVYGKIFSLGRQRQSFFPNGRPLYAYVPWWISQASVLGWHYGVKKNPTSVLTRPQGLMMSFAYFWLAGLLNLKQHIKQARVDLLERATFLMPVYQRLRQLRRGAARRIHVELKEFRRTRKRVRRVGKDLGDSDRRRRVIAKAVKRSRSTVRGLPGRAARLAARGIGALPGVDSHVVPRLVGEKVGISTGALDLFSLRRTVEKLRRSTGPVVCGPFLGDPAYELLYWIPFLRWLQKAASIDASRIVAISRGGVSSWYEGVCGRYAESLEVTSLADIAGLSHERWWIQALEQPLGPVPLETRIVGEVTRRLTIDPSTVVHPAEMQHVFRHVWNGAAPADLIHRHVVWQRLVPPPLPPALRLPDTYTAVHFAFGQSLPDTLDNRRKVRALFDSVTARDRVVLLNTGVSMDGSDEFDPGSIPNLWRIDAALTPSTSLAVQSAVLGRATGFVGSFDGLACLAAQYGVQGRSIYSEKTRATRALVNGLSQLAAKLETTAVAQHVSRLSTPADASAVESQMADVFDVVE